MKKRRRASHCGKNSVCCPKCSKRFSQTSYLVTHQRTHSGGKTYPCPQCNKCFSRSSHLSTHMRIHTREKPYQCQQCKQCFSQATSIVRHMRTHTGEKPYQCQQCKKRFSSSRALVIHMSIHTGEKPYQCQQCQKCYSYSYHLSTHMRIHTGEKPYQCQHCQMRFSQSCYLSKHKRIHTGEKPYQCHQCKRCFSHKYNLLVHERIHTGEKPYQCQQCQMRFSQSSHLSRHKMIHTGKKIYECHQCKKRFSRSSSLEIHKRTHTGEKPYQCQNCNQRFSCSRSLVIHLRIHTGEKPHQCMNCNKTFSTSSALTVHRRIHTGEKPRQCTHCNKRCKSQFTCHQSSRNKFDVCVKTCISRLPQQDSLLDELATLVEVNETDTTIFQVGYYGTTPVTLAVLPAAATVEILSSSQPCLHPNIAMIYGMTLMSGSCTTLLMENVTTSLSHVLDDVGDQLSLRERLDIAVGCVSAVDYLHHQLGVSHGMVTCDYIFLSNTFAAKLLDPMVASVIENSGFHFHTCEALQDDIRHLGHTLLSLFHGVELSIDPDVCHESGECCAPHRLHSVLGLMVNGEEADVPTTKAIISTLEGMRQTNQYRQCMSSQVWCAV